MIAIKVRLSLPERIVAHPELFNLGGRKPEVVRARSSAFTRRALRSAASAQ